MGATVISTLKTSDWTSEKPACYKGQDLDKALKAYDGVSGTPITTIRALPTLPTKPTLGGFADCIKELQAAIIALQKTHATIKQITDALGAVSAAASKTSADLLKLSKGKDVDEHEYKNAASSASSIGSTAATFKSNYS